MEIEVTYVPMFDTGIGREAGYESDAALIEASNAERAALDQGLRAKVEDHERRMLRRFLLGDA